MSRTLLTKITSGKANIVIMGLGYVGLPLAMMFARRGFKTYGLDISEHRIDRLKNKKSYISDVPTKHIVDTSNNGTFVPTTDLDILSKADVILMCVPTPLKRKYTPDISFIQDAIKTIAKKIKKNTLVVLESTTYPGTTNELIKPALEKSGLKVGKEFFLAFSPERIDPGNKKYPIHKIPKVVGGVTPTCSKLTQALYKQVIDEVHPVSSPSAAEMTKLLENSFRIVNIGWINEIAMTCNHMGIDVWEVIEAAKTKPFGFMPFYPGLGVGGHCIPDDPMYLYWKAKKYGFNSKYIKLAADVNHGMPDYAIERIKVLINKPIEQSKILILGVTYKKDVHDLRKSPSIYLISKLKFKKADVQFYDPIIPYLDLDGLRIDTVKLTPAILKSYDMVVLAVDHTDVDYDLVYKHAKHIFDVKNIYKDKRSPKITRL